jgi:uncharacterized membrane protein YkvA (DUF1232 family)
MKSANPKHWDFYKKFRQRMQIYCDSSEGKTHRFREMLLLGPDLLHLCLHLVVDKEVHFHHKAKLGIAIAYFISPLDLIPELIFGPLGYLDDIAVTAYVLNSILNEIPSETIERYWAGQKDVLTVVKSITMIADRMIGKGLWDRFMKNPTTGHIGMKNTNHMK